MEWMLVLYTVQGLGGQMGQTGMEPQFNAPTPIGKYYDSGSACIEHADAVTIERHKQGGWASWEYYDCIPVPKD